MTKDLLHSHNKHCCSFSPLPLINTIWSSLSPEGKLAAVMEDEVALSPSEDLCLPFLKTMVTGGALCFWTLETSDSLSDLGYNLGL